MDLACCDPAADRQLPRTCPGQVGGPDRITIHGGVVEGRKVDRGVEFPGKDASGGVHQRNALGLRHGPGNRDCLGGGDVDGNTLSLRSCGAVFVREWYRVFHVCSIWGMLFR